jgi:hypothetical protein
MGFKGCLVFAGLLCAGQAMSAVNPNPAARVHVKAVGTQYYKYTSKLKSVVELNFTLNFNHTDGKKILTNMLGTIAKDYGTGTDSAFKIKKFIGPGAGASVGLPTTVPTLADLNAADVIVTNNISNMHEIPSKSAAFGTAFETAVKTTGKSVVGFHGSGDGGTGWGFYTNDLHPVNYNAHGAQSAQPVYKKASEEKHIISDSILLAAVKKMDVPMGVDAGGKEVKVNTSVRLMKNEWYRFGRNLLADTKYAPLTTCFLLYDPSASSIDLSAQYKYAGGNVYAWMLKVGAGRAFYLPPGHDGSELNTGDSFDGGTGDLERFYAQTLFFAAGYDSVACTGTACNGLPVVDAQNHLTGKICDAACAGPVSLNFDRDFGFTNMSGKAYVAKLTDVSGRVVATKAGKGAEPVQFEKSSLGSGVYFLSVKVGKEAPVVRRYMVAPAMR